jgi:hypothetical protein
MWVELSIGRLRHRSPTELHVIVETTRTHLYEPLDNACSKLQTPFHFVQTISTAVVLFILQLSPFTSMSASSVLSSLYIVVPLSL